VEIDVKEFENTIREIGNGLIPEEKVRYYAGVATYFLGKISDIIKNITIKVVDKEHLYDNDISGRSLVAECDIEKIRLNELMKKLDWSMISADIDLACLDVAGYKCDFTIKKVIPYGEYIIGVSYSPKKDAYEIRVYQRKDNEEMLFNITTLSRYFKDVITWLKESFGFFQEDILIEKIYFVIYMF